MSNQAHAPGFLAQSATLADRLAAAQRRYFVGRQEEKALFRSALSGDRVFLLHIYGPGGVGKTTLLREFMALAKALDTEPIYLDARTLEPSPEGFYRQLRLVLGLADDVSPFSALASQPSVLMVDTYETLTPLDAWLRETFLPSLPATTLVVFAGRTPLSPSWRVESSWQDVVKSVSLRNLRPEESRTFLSERGVPDKQHKGVLEYTHGHPLALSLVVDVLKSHGDETATIQVGRDPDVVRVLLERFIDQVPSPEHRQALEACALVRVTTEPLLGVALELDDAHDYFEWLRGLSFVESSPAGLFPHDLAREALDADLRWRNPDRYAELHSRVRAYYTRKLLEVSGAEQQRLLFDDVYLHRHNPMVKPFLEWGEYGSVFGERGSETDHPALLRMVEQHEGTEAAELAAHWFAKQPEGLTVYRSAGKEPCGFLLTLRLDKADPADIEADPATGAAMAFARRHAPPRPGEDMIMFRFWMTRNDYQSVSPTQSIIFLNAVQTYFAHPNLAWSFFPCADGEFWSPALNYMDITRAEEADFRIEGKDYCVFAHDWRAVAVPAWLELLGERELATDLKPEDLANRSAPLVVLSEPEFKDAVKDALRSYTRPDKLAQNPLLRSRLVTDSETGEGSVERLQALVLETAAALRSNPKDGKGYRALLRTYLEPAASQEIAAELLNLPFSTYRRHLKAAVERVTDLLWQRELEGVGS